MSIKYKTERSIATGEVNAYVALLDNQNIRITRFATSVARKSDGVTYKVFINSGIKAVAEFWRLSDAKQFVAATMEAEK
jgi:hypothetical protein